MCLWLILTHTKNMSYNFHFHYSKFENSNCISHSIRRQQVSGFRVYKYRNVYLDLKGRQKSPHTSVWKLKGVLGYFPRLCFQHPGFHNGTKIHRAFHSVLEFSTCVHTTTSLKKSVKREINLLFPSVQWYCRGIVDTACHFLDTSKQTSWQTSTSQYVADKSKITLPCPI